jgi:hypothetical protein
LPLSIRKKELGQPWRRLPSRGSPRGPGHVPAYPQFLIERFTEVAQIWKAAAERRKAFEGEELCSAKGEGVATAIIVISSDDEE